jgi:hypothetical protein
LSLIKDDPDFVPEVRIFTGKNDFSILVPMRQTQLAYAKIKEPTKLDDYNVKTELVFTCEYPVVMDEGPGCVTVKIHGFDISSTFVTYFYFKGRLSLLTGQIGSQKVTGGVLGPNADHEMLVLIGIIMKICSHEKFSKLAAEFSCSSAGQKFIEMMGLAFVGLQHRGIVVEAIENGVNAKCIDDEWHITVQIMGKKLKYSKSSFI